MNYDFKKCILNGTLHHGFIIEGPHTVNKVAVVKRIIKGIFCQNMPGEGCDVCVNCRKVESGNYGDIYYVEPDQARGSKVFSIKDEAIIELQENLMRKPVDGDRNIAIIRGADTMTIRAYNRLLKTLEEPVPGTVIFLLSENINSMPITIRSRCIHVRVDGEAEEFDSRVMEKAQELINLIVDGDFFYLKKQFLDENIDSREEAYILLDAMERIYMDILLRKRGDIGRFSKDYIFRAIRYIEEARREIQLKLNMMYSLEKMILNIGG